MWVNFAAAYQAVYQTLVAVFVGIIVYAFLNARREDAGQIPEPVDSPQLRDAHEGT
jgi:basic amino acid/polyamine antiporter, APA family